MDYGLDDIKRTLRERQQAAAVANEVFYGGQQAWFDACRTRNALDPDHRIVRVIARLLRAAGDAVPHVLRRQDQELLDADPAVSAFWHSVAQAGPDGWREERQRLKTVQTQACSSAAPQERLMTLDTNAVKSLLGAYRLWGQMLIDTRNE